MYSKKDRTAYHEAGHVVARLMLGEGYMGDDSFDDVTIEEDEDSHGRVGKSDLSWWDEEEFHDLGTLYSPGPLKLRAIFEYEIMVSLAGTIAEKHFVGDTDDEVRADIDTGFEGDISNVMDMAMILSGGDTEAAVPLIEYHRIKVESLIRREDNWALIEAIAKELLSRTTLTYEECLEVKARWFASIRAMAEGH